MQASVTGTVLSPQRIVDQRAMQVMAAGIRRDVARAFSYAMALHKGEPVVAVCEGVDGGRARLHVRLWKNGAWQGLGNGPLNVLGEKGGALKPALISDGKNLYVAWPELQPNHTAP